jgi:ribonuclease HI
MRITMICDASYCDRHRVAGYGFWIASQRGKLGGAGNIVDEVENNNTAEMMAICNAIWKGIEAALIQRSDQLLIQSDCLSAMDKMKGLQKAVTAQERSVLAYYLRTVQENGLHVTFRHVRGHTSIDEPRYAANRLCDRTAKAQMRLARSKKIAAKITNELQGVPNAV